MGISITCLSCHNDLTLIEVLHLKNNNVTVRSFLRKYILLHGKGQKSDFLIGKNFPEWLSVANSCANNIHLQIEIIWIMEYLLGMIHMIEQFYHN